MGGAEFCALVEASGAGDQRHVQPIHVAAYVAALGNAHTPSTLKSGQITPFNPAPSEK